MFPATLCSLTDEISTELDQVLPPSVDLNERSEPPFAE
jgi:hypothetical protein